ncbi:MAG: YlcI/YnfO family protein [Rivularia sp. (in: cyanobacteria)]
MEREAITIRFPANLLTKARSLKQESESLNDLVVVALESFLRQRKALAAHQRIVARSEAVKVKTGVKPASTDIILSFREGKERRE